MINKILYNGELSPILLAKFYRAIALITNKIVNPQKIAHITGLSAKGSSGFNSLFIISRVEILCDNSLLLLIIFFKSLIILGFLIAIEFTISIDFSSPIILTASIPLL